MAGQGAAPCSTFATEPPGRNVPIRGDVPMAITVLCDDAPTRYVVSATEGECQVPASYASPLSQSAASSSCVASKGSARTRASPAWVASRTQRPSKSA